MSEKQEKIIRRSVSYKIEDYEWLRKIAYENHTDMSKIIRYMIHYFRDNRMQTNFDLTPQTPNHE